MATHAELAVSACVEEFEGSVSIQVLKEVLMCVGAGPVVWVTNSAFAAIKKHRTLGSSATKGWEGGEKKDQLSPPQIQPTNSLYLVAAKVQPR